MNIFESMTIMIAMSSIFKAKRTILCQFDVMAEYESFDTSYTLCQANVSSTELHVTIVVDLDSSHFPYSDIGNCSHHLYIISHKENDISKLSGTQPIVIESVGYHYAEFLYQLFDFWEMNLDGITIIADESGTAGSMLWSLKDGVAAVVLKSNGNHADNLNLMTNTRNLFVIGRRSLITSVLNKGLRLNMMSASNVWFVLSTDGPFELFMKTDSVILSLSDNYIESLKTTISNTMEPYDMTLPNETFTCTNLTVMNNLTHNLTNNIQMTEFSIDVLEVNEKTDKKVLKWTAFHRIQSEETEKVGTFNKHDVTKLSRPQLMPTLRISYVQEQPYIFRSDDASETTYSGFLVDIVKDLSKNVNFSYVLIECTDGVYGMKEGDDWTGCIGDLLHNRADMILAPLAVTSEREAVLDFLTPYLGTSGLQVLWKLDVPTDFNFLDVYTTIIWLSFIATIFVTSVLLRVFHRFAPDSGQHSSKSVNLGDAVWFVISSVCYEGSDRLWINGCTKVLIAGFWFFSTILMSCFTANMAAFLTNIRLEGDSSTVFEEIKDRVSNFTIVGNSFEFSYIKKLADYEEYFTNVWKDQMYKTFQDENNTVWSFPLSITYSNLMDNLLRNPLPNSTESAIKKMNENFKVVLDSSVASYIHLHNKQCAVGIATDPIAMHPIGLAVTQGSKYKKVFSERLLMLQQTQTFEMLIHKWWNHESSSCTSKDSNTGLSLRDLQNTFYLLCLGMVTSLLVLFVEIFYYKVKHKIVNRLPSQKAVQSGENVKHNSTNYTENNEEDTSVEANEVSDSGSIDLIFTIEQTVDQTKNKNTQDTNSSYMYTRESPELEFL